MRTVYVVIDDDDSRFIVSIYSTREAADEACATLNAGAIHAWYIVEEWEVKE